MQKFNKMPSYQNCCLVSGRYLQYLASFLAALTIFTSGSHMVWTSPSLPILYASNSSIETSLTAGSLMGSLSLIANLPSSSISAIVADHFGRKTVIYFAPIFYLIGWLLIAFARDVMPILIAKVIVGIGDGCVHTVLPMYIGEIADTKIRGSLGLCITVMCDLGILYTYCVGPWLSIKTMALISTIFPIVSLMLFLFMPKTPYYYLINNDGDKARITLMKLRGSRFVSKEFNDMQESVQQDMSNNKTYWKDLFLSTSNLRSLCILIGLITLQQFSGISAILIYAELLFNSKGTIPSYYGPIFLGSFHLFGDVLTMSIVNYIPRRTMLLLSCFGCFISLFTQTLYLILKSVYTFNLYQYDWLPIVCLLSYIFSYSLGLGTIPTVLSNELFTTSIKAKGMAVLDNYSDITGFIIALSYQFVTETWGHYVPFVIFSIVAAFGICFVKIFVPETKGRTLEEIQISLQSNQ